MPGVDNRDLVASCRTMGLVVRSCTIGSACTQPWATALRLRRGPAWRRSPCALRRDILISSLHTTGGGPDSSVGWSSKAYLRCIHEFFPAHRSQLASDWGRGVLPPCCGPALGEPPDLLSPS